MLNVVKTYDTWCLFCPLQYCSQGTLLLTCASLGDERERDVHWALLPFCLGGQEAHSLNLYLCVPICVLTNL
jgi:hypothetical protein